MEPAEAGCRGSSPGPHAGPPGPRLSIFGSVTLGPGPSPTLSPPAATLAPKVCDQLLRIGCPLPPPRELRLLSHLPKGGSVGLRVDRSRASPWE